MAKQHPPAAIGKKPKRKSLFATMREEFRRNKRAFAVYLTVLVLVLAVLVRNLFSRHPENVFTCFLALLLLLIPSFLKHGFHIKLPTVLESLAYIFVFCAEILGEIGNYYQIFPFWDTMLHTVNGFMFAAFGFCLIDIFNKNKRFRFELSPAFLALVAFCFSMTIGVLWEFFEFAADTMLGTDMQKDFFVTAINTVSIPGETGEKVTHLRDIADTVITLSDGSTVRFTGYLDVGLRDTMKDLFVNFAGALLFSVIGFLFVKKRGKGRIARQFIPVPAEDRADESPAVSEGSEGKETV